MKLSRVPRKEAEKSTGVLGREIETPAITARSRYKVYRGSRERD